MSAASVVFLPGLLCDGRLFAKQTSPLERPWHIADLTKSKSIEGMARNVLSTAPERFAAVGLSMGGIVAFEMLRQAPGRISHLMLLDTTPFADPPDRQAMRLAQIAEASAGGLRELAAESLKPMYLSEAHREDKALLDEILDMAMGLGPRVFENQSLALRERPDSVATLKHISVPTAIVCGEEDQLCTPDTHKLMAQAIPGATLHILKDCGHMATMEQPDRVNAIMADLLERTETKRRRRNETE
ncbi:MAG: alpha/beta hydrolase [Pseudomonadota bacterium]